MHISKAVTWEKLSLNTHFSLHFSKWISRRSRPTCQTEYIELLIWKCCEEHTQTRGGCKDLEDFHGCINNTVPNGNGYISFFFFTKVVHLRKTTNLRYLFTYWTQSSVCMCVCKLLGYLFLSLLLFLPSGMISINK